MNEVLAAISRRRAVKVFDSAEVSEQIRQQLLDAARYAPSSFNMQPYQFFWVGSQEKRAMVAKLCVGQRPAVTASALVVAVADIGSLASTAEAQAEWMRRTGFPEEKVREYERTAKIGRILFMPGPFGIFAAFKRVLFRTLNFCKTSGVPPLSREEVFKWAAKGTALACENLMIAAEVLGFQSCPMEGFDGRRLGKYLGLSREHHEIVMVIAIGRKAPSYHEQPQWRRALEATVTVL